MINLCDLIETTNNCVFVSIDKYHLNDWLQAVKDSGIKLKYIYLVKVKLVE